MSKNPKISNVINFENLKVFGIMSNLPIHSLAWYLNREFDWDLIRIGDIMIDKNHCEITVQNELNKKTNLYPILRFTDEESKYEADLIGNKAQGISYLTELKRIDYLLTIYGEFDYLPPQISDAVRKLDSVQMATEIPIEKIADKFKLVYYKQ